MEQRGEKAHGRRMLCEVRKMNWSSGKNWQCEQSMRGSEAGLRGAKSIEIHLMKKLDAGLVGGRREVVNRRTLERSN